MAKEERQLWCVPWEEGKSRIVPTTGGIAYLTKVVDRIHIVYENKHLMERDFNDFKFFWDLLGAAEAVKYHVGLDFAPESNSLIIFDEADAFIFRDPVKFNALIIGCFCICFTATPDNCDPKGV